MTDYPQYVNHADPLVEAMTKLDVGRLIDGVTDAWFNQTLCHVDDAVVRLGVLRGEYHWHRHDREDEFFFVLDGLLRIEIDGESTVELGPRQCYTVPKGRRHRPLAPVRTSVLMIERAGVTATGDE